MWVFLLTQMFPVAILIVPIYTIMANLGLINTKASLVIAYCTVAVPFCAWMMRGYFDTIPKELDEAASLDGLGPFGTFYRVIPPLARPGIAVTAFYTFLTAWGEVAYAIAFLQTDRSPGRRPAAVRAAVQRPVGEPHRGRRDDCTIPAGFVFFFAQKHLVAGPTAGGTKASRQRERTLGLLPVDPVAAAVVGQRQHGRALSGAEVVEAHPIADHQGLRVGGDLEELGVADAGPEVAVVLQASALALELGGQHRPGGVGVGGERGDVVADEGLHPGSGRGRGLSRRRRRRVGGGAGGGARRPAGLGPARGGVAVGQQREQHHADHRGRRQAGQHQERTAVPWPARRRRRRQDGCSGDGRIGTVRSVGPPRKSRTSVIVHRWAGSLAIVASSSGPSSRRRAAGAAPR